MKEGKRMLTAEIADGNKQASPIQKYGRAVWLIESGVVMICGTRAGYTHKQHWSCEFFLSRTFYIACYKISFKLNDPMVIFTTRLRGEMRAFRRVAEMT